MQSKRHGIHREVALLQIKDDVALAHAGKISRDPFIAVPKDDTLLVCVPGNDLTALRARKSRDQIIKAFAERTIKIMCALDAGKRIPHRTADKVHRHARGLRDP
jgi:hypothetical protein